MSKPPPRFLQGAGKRADLRHGVGDAGQHRRDDETGVETGSDQPLECLESHMGHGRACFEQTNDSYGSRDERDINTDAIVSLKSFEDVYILTYQRTFGNNADGKIGFAAQPLENGVGDSKLPLGGLVRIGGRPDDNRVDSTDVLTSSYAGEIAVERGEYRVSLFHEDAAFEHFPSLGFAKLYEVRIRHLTVVMCALDHVTVCVARVTVGTPKLAADIWVDRPKPHPGTLGRVHDGLDPMLDKSRTAASCIEHAQAR